MRTPAKYGHDAEGTHLVVTLQRREAGSTLHVHDLDELRTEICVHGRDQTPRLDTVFDQARRKSDRLRI